MTKIRFEMESDKQIDKVLINLIKGKETVDTKELEPEHDNQTPEPPKPAMKVVKHPGFDPNMMDIVNS